MDEPEQNAKEATPAPESLSVGGRTLWESIAELHDLDPSQLVQLEEACRAKDRLDKLDRALAGDAHLWMELTVDLNSDGTIYELRITNALAQANATANLMKQLLAALRLPDGVTGKKPQQRSARGAYAPKQSGTGTGSVSSIERARRRKGA